MIMNSTDKENEPTSSILMWSTTVELCKYADYNHCHHHHHADLTETEFVMSSHAAYD